MKPWIQDWFIAAGAYPRFCSLKRLEVFLLPLDGMLVHRRSLPHNLSGFSNILPVPIYSSGWREALWEQSVLPKNTTQCPWPGLEPGPLAPESSTLTMRPPHLPRFVVYQQLNNIDFNWICVKYFSETFPLKFSCKYCYLHVLFAMNLDQCYKLFFWLRITGNRSSWQRWQNQLP